ncbi:MAG: hypothetical protein JWO56_839 [Acidobacteria bacterium]|nr:hypothetical protein [Acidobacteriota bacterium]
MEPRTPVRLPRYQLGVLHVLAGDGREWVDTMLTRMFEELADLNQERLARLIPGLAEAIGWPEAGESGRACRCSRPGDDAQSPHVCPMPSAFGRPPAGRPGRQRLSLRHRSMVPPSRGTDAA